MTALSRMHNILKSAFSFNKTFLEYRTLSVKLREELKNVVNNALVSIDHPLFIAGLVSLFF